MKKLSTVISVLLLICLLAGVATVAVPKIMGVKLFAVLSPSMEPKLSAGDLVYAVPTDFENIQEGDIISFVLNDDLTVATHRIESIDSKNRRFTTKGDANETADSNPVKYENVVGVVKFSIPHMGSFAMHFSQPKAKIVLITAVVAMAALSLLLSSISDKKTNKMKEDEHGHD